MPLLILRPLRLRAACAWPLLLGTSLPAEVNQSPPDPALPDAISSDPAAMEAHDLAAAFAAGGLSPVEAVRAVIARAQAAQSAFNPFALIDEAGALAAARASEARWRNGEPLSPLDGVPVSVKDLILTHGLPTRRGSLTVDPGGPWEHDAPLVERLKAAGLVIFAKTTTTEFGASPYSWSPLTGETLNPWNPAYGVGGSSMGAAAQLAAGAGALAVGTDAAGSIRMPAAFAGVFGFKPSYGRIAQWPPSAAGDLAHAGPMARSVRDLALLQDVLAGPHWRDWESLPAAPPTASALGRGVRGQRVAVTTRFAGVMARADIAERVWAAARALEGLGAHVEEAEPPMDGLFDLYDAVRFGFRGAGFSRMAMVADQQARMDPFVASLRQAAAGIDLARFMDGQARRAELAAACRRFHGRFDLLLTPAVARGPHLASHRGRPGEAWYREEGAVWSPFTFPFNLTKQPAAAQPYGFDRDGLPVGVQIVGRPFDDAGVLAAVAALAETLAPSSPPAGLKVSA